MSDETLTRRTFLTAAAALVAGFVLDEETQLYVPQPERKRFWDFGGIRKPLEYSPTINYFVQATVAFDIETQMWPQMWPSGPHSDADIAAAMRFSERSTQFEKGIQYSATESKEDLLRSIRRNIARMTGGGSLR